MNLQTIIFSIGVPGKVILYGEHSVVYGKTAIAASVNLKTTLKFSNADREVPCVVLDLPCIDFLYDFQIKDLQNLLRKHNIPLIGDVSHRMFSLNTPESIQFDKFVFLVKSFLEAQKIPGVTKQQESAILSFLCLFLGMFSSVDVTLPNCHIQITSELDIGAGMGSSTSYNICLAAAFLQFIRRSKLKSHSDPCEVSKEGYKSFKYWSTNLLKFESGELDLISRWGHVGDKIMHGNPSGIDNAVCTYGSVIEFRKGSKHPDIKIIPDPKFLKILLVNTKIPRDTKKLVSSVASLRDRLACVVEPIMESLDSIALSASEVLRRMSHISENFEPPNSVALEESLSEEISKLEELIDVNQKLLEAVGVSHNALEHVCNIARAEGLHAKLTGAGGGGYAYVLLPFRNYDRQLCAVKMSYERFHFPVQQVMLGGPGVTLEDTSMYPTLDPRQSNDLSYLLSTEAISIPDVSKMTTSALQLSQQDCHVKQDEELDEWPWPFDLREAVKNMFESQIKGDLQGGEIAIPLKSLCAVNVPKPLPQWMDKITKLQSQITPMWRNILEKKPFTGNDASGDDETTDQFGTDTAFPDDLIKQDFVMQQRRSSHPTRKHSREKSLFIPQGSRGSVDSKSGRPKTKKLSKRISIDLKPTESEQKFSLNIQENYHIPKQASFRENMCRQDDHPLKWLKDQFPPFGKREWAFDTDIIENSKKLKDLKRRHKEFLSYQKPGCEYFDSMYQSED